MSLKKLRERLMPMGNKDTVTKQYISGNTVFADICNFYLYHGEQVIKPEHLHSLDPQQFTFLNPSDYSNKKVTPPISKQRDVLKYLTAKATDTAAYLILGIENQSDIHYAMPVRNMLYDALQYEQQMQEIAEKHRNNKEYDSFVSSIQKNDKLIPVITLVVYFGSKPWDGPTSLHDMLQIDNPALLPYVANYALHIIDPHRMDESALAQFQSSAREVFQFIKYSRDKNKVLELAKEKRYQTLDALAAKVINICTNSRLPFKINDEEETSMCQAIDEICEDSRNEGRNERSKEMAMALLKKNIMPLVEIAELTKLPLEEVEALQKAI